MSSTNSTYTGFQFDMDGHPALAVMNEDLKNLDAKNEYPYSVFIEIIPDKYNINGHPEEDEYDYLVQIEKTIIDYLEQETKTLHAGHIVLYRTLQIIFYTNDKVVVDGYLDYYLSTIERESNFEIEEDSEWENVSAFYDLL